MQTLTQLKCYSRPYGDVPYIHVIPLSTVHYDIHINILSVSWGGVSPYFYSGSICALIYIQGLSMMKFPSRNQFLTSYVHELPYTSVHPRSLSARDRKTYFPRVKRKQTVD